ncbi:MAG: prepilin-type N-terminal cleavage/methylation domain-containing protein [Candidatus Paceibacterota bacterium]
MKQEQSQLIRKEQLNTKGGFSLIEVILASSIFLLIVTAFSGAYLYGQESTVLAGNRASAVFLAEEGLEAVRNIRDEGFSNLVDGTYGLAVSGNEWVFSGSSDGNGIFTREVEVATVDSVRKAVTSTVTWQQNQQRTGTVALTTRFTDWASLVDQSESFVVDTSSANIGGGGNKELKGITIENTGTVDIVIDKIKVTWDNGNLIEEIKIEGARIWKHNNEGTPDGKQISGTELDIEDFTLVSGSGALDIDKFKFDDDMTGSVFTIIFTLGDGTTVQVTVDLSGGGGPTCGTQSDELVLSTSGASVGGGGNKELKGVTVQNTDASCDIVIDKITLTWTNGKLIEEIKIEGARIWKHNNEGSPDGKQPTGTELDVVDYTILSGNTDTFDKFKFNGNMTGDTFDITFTLGDGSTKSTGNFSP